MREQHVTVLGQCQYTRPNRDTNGEDVVGPVVVWECAAIQANGRKRDKSSEHFFEWGR